MTITLSARRQNELRAELLAQRDAAMLKDRKHVRHFSEEAVIRVWRDHDAITTGHFGHAALSLRGPHFAEDSGRGVYISWWPANGAGLREGVASFFGRHDEGTAGASYREDKYDEMSNGARQNLTRGEYAPRPGQSPTLLPEGYSGRNAFKLGNTRFAFSQSVDAKIRLPGCRAEDVWFGLDLARIEAWWHTFLANDPTYQLASRTHSCAGVVRQALKAGGAKAYVEAPRSEGFATPSEMEVWSVSLRDRLDQLNREASTFLRRIATGPRSLFTIGGRGTVHNAVPQVDRWRRMSTRPDGKRGQNVAALDAHLREFHRPVVDHKDVARHLAARVQIFQAVVRAVLRDRDPHDEKVLQSIGRAVLESGG